MDSVDQEKSSKTHRIIYYFAMVLLGIALSLSCYYGGLMKQPVPREGGHAPQLLELNTETRIVEDGATFQDIVLRKCKRIQSHYLLNVVRRQSNFKNKLSRIVEYYRPCLRNQGNALVEEMSSIPTMSAVAYYMAWDSVTGSSELDAYLSPKINDIFQNPCENMVGEIQKAYSEYLYDLKLILREYQESIVDIRGEYNLDVNSKSSESQQKFLTDIDALKSKVKDMANSTKWTGVGVVIEAAFIRTSILAVISVTKSVCTRLLFPVAAKLTGSAAIAVADGPLPIGDIIAVAGVAWTCCEVHHVRAELPVELQKQVDVSIDNLLQNYEDEYLARSSQGCINIIKKSIEN